MVKEFSKQGHEVDVLIPKNNFDYQAIEKEFANLNVKKIEAGFFLNKAVDDSTKKTSQTSLDGTEKVRKDSFIKKFKRNLIKWFYPGGFNFEFSFTASKFIRKQGKIYDGAISIGLPINSHIALYRSQRWKKRIKTLIADYGDPYSNNETIDTPFFHRILEKRMLKKFHYVIIPTTKMIPAFEPLVSASKIRIFPQAVDLSQFTVSSSLKSEKSKIVEFAYAGNFYEKIRNPEELIVFLEESQLNFQFHLYTNMDEQENRKLVNGFKERLGNKLEIHDMLSRVDCIFELSQYDFLVNISNTTSTQTPSKLIDYKIANRPIFSYSPGSFDKHVFTQFMSLDFQQDEAKNLSLENFDVTKVVSEISQLIIAEGKK